MGIGLARQKSFGITAGVMGLVAELDAPEITLGHQLPTAHHFLTSLWTKPEALLRLIRQCWSIENEWHWTRDTQLYEDAHRYANRNGAPLFAFLRTVVINLLRNGGYRSVHAGQQK
ncbi:hypothetical protein [Synechococcus sp. CBW1108]|uniref:hypothetical protein n=1 Tax=Synechococcus sp. CBW1108 TaxID=1353147 RepID=UPI0018CFBF11|nr:hypothetical protein [Synechococcus sp. CBW1108]QPN72028.1 hypothetical protein H8F27_13400 [Synechococcus sp. CBW1108]